MERLRVAGRYVKAAVEDKAAAEGAGAKKLMKAPRPTYCRSFTRRRVAEALPEITEKFVAEAKKGSIQHAKLLIKLGELDSQEIQKPPQRRGKGFAGRLLDELTRGAGS